MNIPAQLFYDNWQTDKDDFDQTPLMIWIEYNVDDPIPKELYYDGYQTDREGNGHTPLMLWIKDRNK